MCTKHCYCCVRPRTEEHGICSSLSFDLDLACKLGVHKAQGFRKDPLASSSGTNTDRARSCTTVSACRLFFVFVTEEMGGKAGLKAIVKRFKDRGTHGRAKYN